MTFRHALEPFILHGQADRLYAKETIEKIRECFNSRFLPVFADMELESIAALDILEFRRQLVNDGLSVARQYNLLTILKLFFTFCRKVLKLSVLDPAEIKLPRRRFGRVEYLTESEIHEMIRCIPTHTFTGSRLRALIEVLLSTGMRISEALSLNRDSIQRGNGTAQIIGKGSKPRTVFFSMGCLSWIDRYLAFRRDTSPVLFITTGKTPRRLRRGDMSKVFKRLRQDSGITKHLTPHLLRHTFCTSLLHNGADIMFIKELAGHSDIGITARYYLGVDDAALKEVLMRCQTYGWSRVVNRQLPPTDTPGTFRALLSQPAGPIPNSSDRSSPDVHAQESP